MKARLEEPQDRAEQTDRSLEDIAMSPLEMRMAMPFMKLEITMLGTNVMTSPSLVMAPRNRQMPVSTKHFLMNLCVQGRQFHQCMDPC